MVKTIGTWKGKPFEEYSKEELLEIIEYMGKYYEGRIKSLEETANFTRDLYGKN